MDFLEYRGIQLDSKNLSTQKILLKLYFCETIYEMNSSWSWLGEGNDQNMLMNTSKEQSSNRKGADMSKQDEKRTRRGMWKQILVEDVKEQKQR